jgi:hypothetical protein
MAMIKTASWFAKLPAEHVKIGISRGVPRAEPAGYRRLLALEPGSWFNRVEPDEYLRRYDRLLDRLVPRVVAADLRELAGEGRTPVMVCWENAREIEAGTCWCHRHLVAAWLEERLGIEVLEVGHEDRPLDRWAHLRERGIAPPRYERV